MLFTFTFTSAVPVPAATLITSAADVTLTTTGCSLVAAGEAVLESARELLPITELLTDGTADSDDDISELLANAELRVLEPGRKLLLNTDLLITEFLTDEAAGNGEDTCELLANMLDDRANGAPESVADDKDGMAEDELWLDGDRELLLITELLNTALLIAPRQVMMKIPVSYSPTCWMTEPMGRPSLWLWETITMM